MASTVKIENISEFERFINALPPPKSGHTRVYRGQNSNYPQIIPTAARGNPIEGRFQWSVYCFILAKYLISKEEKREVNIKDKHDDLSLYFFWIKAMSQHYGPGTEYLDVTHSPHIALWFASHNINKKMIEGISGKGEGEHKDDVYTQDECLFHTPATENGWLYVFDVPYANDVVGLKHGEVVDILKFAPAVFQKSARIHAQKACLIYCDIKQNKGDCSPFLVCPPVRVSKDCRFLTHHMTTSSLFPSPDYDEWYKRFLQVPYSLFGFLENGMPAVKRSIPVEMYIEKEDWNDPYFRSTKNKIITSNPCLYLTNAMNVTKEPDAYERAIPIILDNPVITNSPEIASKQWHEEILWKNAGFEFSDGYSEKDLQTEYYNYFIEFSPLEVAYWEELDTGGYGEQPQAVWIRNYNGRLLKASVLVRTYPGSEALVAHLDIIFQKNGRHMVCRSNNGKYHPLIGLEMFVKPVFCALAIIADCIEGIIIKPIPKMVIDENQAVLIATRESAVIKPVIGIPQSDKAYYSVFSIDTGDAYANVLQSRKNESWAGSLFFKGHFSDVPYEDIYRVFNKD